MMMKALLALWFAFLVDSLRVDGGAVMEARRWLQGGMVQVLHFRIFSRYSGDGGAGANV